MPNGRSDPFPAMRSMTTPAAGSAGNIAVGAGDSQIFLYAGTEIAAKEAEQVARDVLARQGHRGGIRAAPLASGRGGPGRARTSRCRGPRPRPRRSTSGLRTPKPPSPSRPASRSGRPGPSSRRTTRRSSWRGKLRSEGRAVVRRWKFLVVGATNEDDARELAEQIRREAPPDATVRAEHSGREPAVHPLLTAAGAPVGGAGQPPGGGCGGVRCARLWNIRPKDRRPVWLTRRQDRKGLRTV